MQITVGFGFGDLCLCDLKSTLFDAPLGGGIRTFFFFFKLVLFSAKMLGFFGSEFVFFFWRNQHLDLPVGTEACSAEQEFITGQLCNNTGARPVDSW